MNKAEVVEILKRINTMYPTFHIPKDRDDLQRLMNGWYEILSSTTFDSACENLKNYVSDPDNKYPPHPGALVKNKTDIDRYYDHMRAAGIQTLEDFDRMKATAVGPTAEQKRRVREMVGFRT